MMRTATRRTLGLTPAEYLVLKRLSTPEKIQDFVSNRIGINHEPNGETLLSVRGVLRERHAHCIEGAMLAACALWVNGQPPLVMYLHAVHDWAHVITLFRRGRCWGAISKTNGPVLRWRDPIYRSLRELAVSYFHEYANRRGQKTLRAYSGAIDLRRFDPAIWVANEKDCWHMQDALEGARHYPLLTPAQEKRIRYRDALERRAGKLLQYPPPPRVVGH
jgi:hypothetical protein